MSTFAANNNVRVYKDKRLTMKKYMMKGLAAVALLIAAAGCSHDSDYTPPTNEEALQNATEKLGISIDPNQDWSMTASLEATISVDLGLDDAYTVAVYDKNPLYTKDVHYYAKTQMKEGETTTLKLDVPSADSTFYVAVYDSKFRRLVQSATIDEGKLNVAFGTSSNNARMTRAAESEYTGTYAKTAGDYLDGLTEAEMAEYEAFTDSDIDGDGFIFGNSTMNSRAFGMKRSAQVWGGGIIRIQPGFNPKDGESVYMYNGEYRVGKLTFGGTGSAAVADNSRGYDARLERPYFIFKSLVENQYNPGGWQFKIYTDQRSTLKLYDLTDKKDVYIQSDGYTGQIEATHTYKVYYEDNQNIGLYAFEHYIQGNVIEDDGNDEQGGDDQGGDDTPVKGASKKYLVDTNTTITKAFHITVKQMNGSVIYVKGKMHIGSNNTLDGVTIVVASGGEVIIHGETNLTTYGRFIVLPGGKITGDDYSSLTVTNGSKCYNAGTIEYKGKLDTNGSDFYNCGTVKVNELDNKVNTGKLTNFGKIYVENNNSAANAHNSEVINGCYFKATGNVGLGSLKMLKNSRLDVGGQLYVPGNGLYGAARNELEHCSVIKAGSIWANSTTLYGPTASGEYAIVQVGSVFANNNTDFRTANNLYLDWNAEYFYMYDGSKIDQDFYNYGYMHGLVENISKWTEESTSTYIIPAGDCTGAGYNPDGSSGSSGGSSGNGGGVIGSPAVWTYAFEDTPLGDYDMNDVVIKVCQNAEDEDMLDVTLCCTGASFNLYVYLDDTELFAGKGEEVHKVFFGQDVKKFVNTVNNGIKINPVTETIRKPANFSFETADFWIKSPLADVHVAKQGEDPHGIAIPCDWTWPHEYHCIKDAYPNFIEFAKNAATTDKTIMKWYETTSTNPVAEHIYTPVE